MTEVTPVPAASVILLRGDPFQVLMIRRHEKASFVPNAWVFPGGAVDAEDERGSTLETMRAAAARELFEEAGISIDPAELVWTSRWITPASLPKRFDTYFFLVRARDGVQPVLNPQEAVDAVWITPNDALARLEPVFPIQKNLEAIAGFTSADELIASRHGAEIKPVQPVMIIEDGQRKFVLP
jgi:8-oxo-dGTP pyrophosphatase MutT (NUDIX family)